jgi:putative ABC transport system permease protein
MGEHKAGRAGGAGGATRRSFNWLLRGLPTTVRYRLFNPAYEDLKHEHLLRLRSAHWPGRRPVLGAWFALRVVALITACYRDSPEFVLVHPIRAVGAVCHALIVPSRTMLIHDIRQAFRLLFKQPLFAGIAVAILALTIGASTAIFSVVNAVLLRPLPFPQSDRLVSLAETSDGRLGAVSPVNFYDWQQQARSFQGMAIYQDQGMTLTSGDRAEAIAGFSVSSTFFPVLGVQPAFGRWFGPEDDRSPGPSSVVLSHALWQRAFGGARDVVGRRAMFDGQPFTIIGVAPEGAEFPEKTDAWFSLGLGPQSRDPKARGAHYVNALARLRPGTTLEQAGTEMAAIAARLAIAYPRTNEGAGVVVRGLVDATVGTARTALLLVLGAVGFLLLIACVNVSGLLMARAATRRVEMAVRAALGAGRLALLRQVLVESLVLAALSAAIGTLLAAWGTRALLAIVPADLPRVSQSGLDVRVLGFTALVTMASAILFGCLPALQSVTASVGGTLKEARRDAGVGGGRRVRHALVMVEVALALVLLVGASLAIRSFDLLTRVSPGFDPRGVLTFSLSLPGGVYKEDRQVAAFYADLMDRLDHTPGVVSSAAVMIPPVSIGNAYGGTFTIEGRPATTGRDEPRAQMRPMTPAYFRTLGIRLLRGRAFDDRDGGDGLPVAIVSETAARRYWPGENPIGRRLRMHVSAVHGSQPLREIVGVVSDVKQSRLDLPSAPMVYLPHAQHPASWMTVMVRSSGDPLRVQGAVSDALRRADKTLVPLEMKTLETHVATSRADQRFRAVLLGLFAGSAFLLAIVGLYAVVAYATTQRRHEIGVRMAIGADARDIVAMVVADGIRPVLAGLVLGCAGAFGLSRVMRTLLFGVRPFEPAIVAGVALAFALASIAACCVPARRAARVDPITALREE